MRSTGSWFAMLTAVLGVVAGTASGGNPEELTHRHHHDKGLFARLLKSVEFGPSEREIIFAGGTMDPCNCSTTTSATSPGDSNCMLKYQTWVHAKGDNQTGLQSDPKNHLSCDTNISCTPTFDTTCVQGGCMENVYR